MVIECQVYAGRTCELELPDHTCVVLLVEGVCECKEMRSLLGHFTLPAVNPLTRYFSIITKRMKTGMIAISEPAKR